MVTTMKKRVALGKKKKKKRGKKSSKRVKRGKKTSKKVKRTKSRKKRKTEEDTIKAAPFTPEAFWLQQALMGDKLCEVTADCSAKSAWESSKSYPDLRSAPYLPMLVKHAAR